MDDSQEFYRQQFWKMIENKLNIQISLHIKNIFKHADIDNHVALLGFKDCGFDFKELEEFVKSDNYKMNVPDGASSSDYYGRIRHPSMFVFSMGEISVIKQILQIIWEENKDSKKMWMKIGRKSMQSAKHGEKSAFSNYQFDKKKEIDKIKILINHKKMKSTCSSDIFNKLSNVTIEVEFSKDEEVISNIACPICDKIFKFKKRFDTNIRNKSEGVWNLSNFSRHLKSHEKRKPSNDNEKEARKEVGQKKAVIDSENNCGTQHEELIDNQMAEETEGNVEKEENKVNILPFNEF